MFGIGGRLKIFYSLWNAFKVSLLFMVVGLFSERKSGRLRFYLFYCLSLVPVILIASSPEPRFVLYFFPALLPLAGVGLNRIEDAMRSYSWARRLPRGFWIFFGLAIYVILSNKSALLYVH